MSRGWLFVLLLATGVALAEDQPKDPPKDPKAKGAPQTQATTSEQTKGKEEPNGKDDPNLGMSILGNQEAPKALVIVPWKRSEIGNALGVSTMLDDSRLPIDKEVFMRVLSYYQVSSQTTRHDGAPGTGGSAAPAGNNDAAPSATAVHRRKS
jgi:hypothetical protein